MCLSEEHSLVPCKDEKVWERSGERAGAWPDIIRSLTEIKNASRIKSFQEARYYLLRFTLSLLARPSAPLWPRPSFLVVVYPFSLIVCFFGFCLSFYQLASLVCPFVVPNMSLTIHLVTSKLFLLVNGDINNIHISHQSNSSDQPESNIIPP